MCILTCDNKPDSDTKPDRIIFIITMNILFLSYPLKTHKKNGEEFEFEAEAEAGKDLPRLKTL